MGLIREPKGVDFYVIDTPWTDKEKKEFSEFIKRRKKELKKIEKISDKTKSNLKREMV